MAKKARAEAKRKKRRERNNYRQSEGVDNQESTEPENTGPALSNAEIVAKVEELHELYDAGKIDLDTFDEQKAALMEQISVV